MKTLKKLLVLAMSATMLVAMSGNVMAEESRNAADAADKLTTVTL